ncbi:RlpA-like protein precursor [Holospora curviuscula]|uniref:Endolytic peptidoglycan transglycosylase RlpA n=2 Tax=Holospora curviuscula TaxID=1082868 RepID=A0A2S5R8E1_9PROT|nr:RlpA-like protein precursor [Holospora curviuscula]
MSGITLFNPTLRVKKRNKRGINWGIFGTLYALLTGCDPSEERVYSRKGTSHRRPYCIKGVWYYPQSHYRLQEEGMASYYGINDGEHEGPDAMGGTYNMHKMTAAHKTLPLPAVVQIHNMKNGRSALVAVTDRGPFVEGRIIDVSVKAAKTLGFFGAGVAPVRIQTLEKESKVLAQLAQKISLKSTNLSDLLPKVREVCQSTQVSITSIPVDPSLSQKSVVHMPESQKFVTQPGSHKSAVYRSNVQNPTPEIQKKLFVSISHLSFDEAMWVRAQSVTFHWGHPRIKKVAHLGSKPFITLLGPFLNQAQAQKALSFFIKYRMSAVLLPLILKGG